MGLRFYKHANESTRQTYILSAVVQYRFSYTDMARSGNVVYKKTAEKLSPQQEKFPTLK